MNPIIKQPDGKFLIPYGWVWRTRLRAIPVSDTTMKTRDKIVILKDGRSARIESVSRHGMVWVRDKNLNLSSFDPKTGWSGDGNWINDLKEIPK